MTTENERHYRKPTVVEWELLAETAWSSLENAKFDDDAQWSEWRTALILGESYKFRWVSLGDGKGQFWVISSTWDFVSRTDDEITPEAVGQLGITNEDIFRTNLLAIYFWMYGE